MSNIKYPLITKWLPGLELVNGHQSGPEYPGYTKYVLAERLERELERGVRVMKQPGFCGHSWQESEHDARDAKIEALLIGARPIAKERKRELSEAQVREVLAIAGGKTYDRVGAFSDEIIERLFGEGGE